MVTLPQESSGAPTVDGEAALVEAACRDPAAFTALYHLYRDRIYWYVRSRTPIEEDAADLTQQIFVQALAALTKYNARRGPFAAWLFGIARHALTNSHQRRKATVSWERLPGALQPVAADDPAAALQRSEDIARLRDLFLALDADKRDLLALRFVARLTIGEIAAVIGTSEAATHKRLARTLRALALHFEEHAHDEQH
jgi:RNA polymerase sigma-70 factor (ECF subfamily)